MTEPQVVTLTAALRGAHAEYRVYEASPGDWRVQATGVMASGADLVAVATANGVSVQTNRAEFF